MSKANAQSKTTIVTVQTQIKPKQSTVTQPNSSLPQHIEMIDEHEDDSKRFMIEESNFNRTSLDEDELQKEVTRKLPAIKFSINKSIMNQYQSPQSLANEIKRCKEKVNFDLIKFANIKDNIIMIATDDKPTFDLLSSNWSQNAFSSGIKFITKESIKQYRILIKGVHEDVEIDSAAIIEQLKNQGIMNATRIIKRGQNLPTSLVKAEAISKERYKSLLTTKVKIFLCQHKVEPFITITQCFNCQKVGHTHYNCTNIIMTCPKCSGSYKLADCTSDSPKCSNCGGSHFSCARQCPYLKGESKKVINNLNNKNNNKFLSKKVEGEVKYSTMTARNTINHDEQQDQLNQLVKAAMNMFIDQLSSTFGKLLNNFMNSEHTSTQSSENTHTIILNENDSQKTEKFGCKSTPNHLKENMATPSSEILQFLAKLVAPHFQSVLSN